MEAGICYGVRIIPPTGEPLAFGSVDDPQEPAVALSWLVQRALVVYAKR
jgi:hypothetical protein